MLVAFHTEKDENNTTKKRSLTQVQWYKLHADDVPKRGKVTKKPAANQPPGASSASSVPQSSVQPVETAVDRTTDEEEQEEAGEKGVLLEDDDDDAAASDDSCRSDY